MDRIPTVRRSLGEVLIEGSRNISVEVADDQVGDLLKYLTLLKKWGAHINLVGTDDDYEIVVRHIVDSLAVLPYLPSNTRSVIDVGSGAGLPGAILAMLRPTCKIIALEPIHKKHAFLSALRRELPLPNFRPQAMRWEDFVSTADFVPVDLAVSRATFAVPEWLKIGAQLVHPDGIVLAMEGSEQHQLPPGATRHAYSLDNRSRAIIEYRC